MNHVEVWDLHTIIDSKAAVLRADMDNAESSGYYPAEERKLAVDAIREYWAGPAKEALAGDTEQATTNALRDLLHDKIGDLIWQHCLLDECDEASYRAQADLADALHEAIWKQGSGEVVLVELVTSAICAKADALNPV